MPYPNYESVWVWKGTTTTAGTNNNVSLGNGAWRSWNSTTTTTVSINLDNVWQKWNQDVFYDAQAFVQKIAQPSAAELERRRVEAERRRVSIAREQVRRDRARAVAQRRAERLLRSNLSKEQREEYDRLKRFHVVGADGRLYRVHRQWSHNLEVVEETPDGRYITEQLCVHPRESVPTEDSMLAQKLMLETDPANLRRIANISRMHRRDEAA